MFELDLSAFERKARELGAAIDQVPYALANTLNDAAAATREYLITDTWPRSVQVRNPGFLRWALRTEYATKRNLTVTLTDAKAQGRGHLALHARGGMKPTKGRIAIPTSAIAAKRGTRGIPKGQRPRGLPNTFIADRGRGPALWQRLSTRQSKKQGKAIRLVYVLKSSVRIPKDVPFETDFAHIMGNEIRARFPGAIAKAMATRR